MGYWKSNSVVTVKSSDPDRRPVVVSFNREITYNDYWNLIGAYGVYRPNWLTEDFLKNGEFVDEENGDVYTLSRESTYVFNSGIYE